MRTFETEYKSFYQRLFNLKSFTLLVSFIFYSYLIFNFKLLTNLYSTILELFIFVIFIIYIIYESKTNIHIITFNKDKIILKGETFNEKWEKTIKIKETQIILKNISSRHGICRVVFYIKLKNSKNTYILNKLETYSDDKIIEIFNEFKNLKEEKIIIDEKITLNRIQEKIKKCPFQQISSK